MNDSPTLRMKAILDNVPQAIDFVARQARAAGCDARCLYQVQVAVDEACANVVGHAYTGMEPGDMEISCRVEEGTLVIQVRDWGQSFDPAGVVLPDVTAPLEERDLGGLGMFLIHQFMDEVAYTFDPERGNELTMRKRLRGAGSVTL